MKSAVVLTLALSACSQAFAIEGSGVETSQTRAVESFRRVRVEGSGEAVVTVGEKQKVTVVCDDNLIDRVGTRVVDGTLELGLERGRYSFSKGLRFEIAVPELAGASIAGSGDIRIAGLDAEAFDVSIAGSGDVEAEGRADRVEVDIAGSGNAALFALAARAADVRIAGSGDVHIRASESLVAKIMGSGSVRYRGDPEVKRSIAGSGEVVKDK